MKNVSKRVLGALVAGVKLAGTTTTTMRSGRQIPIILLQ